MTGFDDGVLGVSGDEEHLEIGPALSRRIRNLTSVHAARKTDIRDQEVDATIRIEVPQGGAAVLASMTL